MSIDEFCSMENNIKGKVVAINGASSGIGEATALTLSAQGAKVVLGARREDRFNNFAAQIVDAGGEAAYLVTDVKKYGDLVQLVGSACETYGRLDVIIIMPESVICPG